MSEDDTMKDSERCVNCGKEFADHDYVRDSIDKYKCPEPYVEMGYGAFHGGDPRKFFPDVDMCSDDEIENHRKACALWDEFESRGETPTPEECPSGWIHGPDGSPVIHVLVAPYGVGFECDQFFEA